MVIKDRISASDNLIFSLIRYFSPLKAIPLFLLLVFIAAAAGAEIPDPLVVAFMPDNYPASFLNDEGEPDGTFPVIIREIARKNGFRIKWEAGSWPENLAKVKSGDVDLMTTLIYTAERDDFLDFNSESVISSWSQVFQIREGVVDTLLDIEGMSVGLMEGDQNARAFIELTESFNIHFRAMYFDSYDRIVEAMQNRSVDLGVFHSLYGVIEQNLLPTGIIFQPIKSYFAVPEGADTEILDLIDRNLREWKADQDSFYYREAIKFISHNEAVFPRWAIITLAILAGIAIFGLVFILILRREVRSRTADLIASQGAYRSTFMDAHVGITHTDLQGRFLRVNPEYERFLGYTEKELQGRTFEDVTHPDDRGKGAKLAEEMFKGLRGSFKYDKRYITKEGRTVWGRVSISAVHDSTGAVAYVTALVEDITAEKQAETRLGDLESRYRGLFENSHQLTAIFDGIGRLIDANQTMKKAFNLPPDMKDLIGQTPADMEWMGPVISLRIQEMMDESLSTGRTIRQSFGVDDTRAGMAMDITIKPITDASGSIHYCIVEAHDVTELINLTHNLEAQVESRTREIKKAQDLLIEAEKMASLGRLVAGMAHEINTPIGVAKTAVSYLKEQSDGVRREFREGTLTEDGLTQALDSLDDLAGILEQNLERAVKLIYDFKLTSADQSNLDIREVNAQEYLGAVMHSLSPRLKEAGAYLEIDIPDEIIALHTGVMNQILINLTENALSHAFEPEAGGMIEVVFRTIGDRRHLHFSDDGKGIDETVRGRIFEPFITTGRSRGFTGLGLNIVYNLVTDVLKGKIVCEDRSGGGTTFHIDFPAPRNE